MMGWFIAGVRKKPRPSRPNFKRAWQSAAWNCIRQRPRLSTAKTGSANPNVKFDFLGYCFRPRLVRRSRDNKLFWGFNPAVSVSALKAMRSMIRELNVRHRTELSMVDIARQINPLLRGWIGYYGRYAPSALYPLLRYVNQTLRAWVMRKFKRFKAHRVRAGRFLERLARDNADLFVHWRLGMTGTFA